MQKKVILLTDYFLPNNNANGLCIYRIGKAMQQQGYEVHVVSYHSKGLLYEEKINNMWVHRVKPQLFYYMRDYYQANANQIKGKLCWQLALLSRRVRKVLLMPWYPVVSPFVDKRYIRKVKEVANQYDITNILAGYNPFESALAAIELKKDDKYKVAVYFMDTFTMTANAKKSKLIYNRCRVWEKKIYRTANGIANFPVYKEHFTSELYKEYQQKMFYIGVPVDFDELIFEEIEQNYFGDSQNTILLYTGGLTMEDRDPVYLLELLQKCEMKDVEMHFFSRGDAETYLSKKQKEDTRITPHGQVPYEELLKARNSAHIMVNIGSRKEIILPSRLFEYIATGKPIIHIYYREDDPCIEYLRKYPDALILAFDGNIEDNVNQMREFIRKKRFEPIAIETLKAIYQENSSEYAAQMFDKIFEGNGEL